MSNRDLKADVGSEGPDRDRPGTETPATYQRQVSEQREQLIAESFKECVQVVRSKEGSKQNITTAARRTYQGTRCKGELGL
jgi:hypothetical protein